MDNFVIRKNKKTMKDAPEINVYTDGACVNNGKPDARAGFGVWFGENDPRNVSESFTGPQTNNRAELLAIIRALTILRDDIEKGRKIIGRNPFTTNSIFPTCENRKYTENR